MKKRLLFIAAIIFLLIGIHPLGAQSLEDILDKHFKAAGQDELLKKETQEIDITVEQMGIEIPMTMKLKRPNKFRMEMEMQGQKMIQTYDGTTAWMVATWLGPQPQELSGAELKQAMEQANFDGELYNYAQKGFEAALAGKVNIEGTPMFHIILTDNDGTEKNYYIDSVDFLVKKIKARIEAQGQTVEVEQNFSSYKSFDGIMMPTRIEARNPAGVAVVNFNNVSFNVPLDDKIFQKP